MFMAFQESILKKKVIRDLTMHLHMKTKMVTGAECPSCHRLFCAQCKVPWHEKMSCNEFQELQRKIKKLDEMSPVHELDVNTLFASYVEHFHGF